MAANADALSNDEWTSTAQSNLQRLETSVQWLKREVLIVQVEAVLRSEKTATAAPSRRSAGARVRGSFREYGRES